MAAPAPSIVVLGAGINGAALARELAMQGVSVAVVDRADLSCGTTAYSSRLIHGGLRYLEYGDFALVRESLSERTRLLRLADAFVQPLKLMIPVSQRTGGWMPAAMRFLRGRSAAKPVTRGLWLVRTGLWMYDRYARDPLLPTHRVHRTDEAGMIPLDRRYRWCCEYWDAQMRYPERFVVALLEDARRAAAEQGADFRVYPYHRASLLGTRVELRSRIHCDTRVDYLEPAAIVNASGAWVDRTLHELGIPSRQRIRGTKGTHLLTFQPALREAIGDTGLYVEADDGRPVFVLPLGGGVLIGTTDTAYTEDPADAVASCEEIEYLLDAVNGLLPDVKLGHDDIHLHYAGIRPLPATDEKTPGAVSRGHWLEECPAATLPLFSIIGGKLTTCRSLAEQACAQIFSRLGMTPRQSSRDRQIPAGQFDAIVDSTNADSAALLRGTQVPVAVARWVIENEWVTTLDDLVERRLMLLYDRGLNSQCLDQLASLLVEAGKLSEGQADAAVRQTIQRLQQHFGKTIT